MKKFSIFIGLLLWLPLGIGGAALQNGYDLFQKALMLERTYGKLQEAITLYEQVVSESQDETIAAKAQLQIGICYEKLGQTEARAAYQTVIDRYPQQADSVKIAKESISKLVNQMAETAVRPKFRKITIPFKLSWWAPTPIGPIVDFGASLSRDGRLAFGSDGSIWVIPVPGEASPDIAGKPLKLTEAMYAFGEGLSWSEDGSLIAFNAARGQDSLDIFTVPSHGGEPTKLISREPSFDLNSSEKALSLSPNGEMLAFQTKWDGEGIIGWSRIQTIGRSTAAPKALIDTKAAMPAFSPNGRLIAYVNYSPKEIRVISASGGKFVRVVDNSNGDVANPVWSPNGSMLAFIVGREIGIVPVSESGKPTTAPTTFELPKTNGMALAGWTSDNKIGLLGGGEMVDTAIYSVPVAGGKALQVTPSGFFFFPRWSPDGKKIWFLNGDTPHTLGSVPAGGGAVSNLTTGTNPAVTEVPPGGGNVISPDGKTVVFAGIADNVKGVNLWIMSLNGGQPVQLTTPLPGQQERFPSWSSDGKSVLFIRLRYTQEFPLGTTDIYKIPAKGGEAQPVTSALDEVCYSPIACSPDGKKVAYFSHDSTLAEGNAPPDITSANCIKIKPIDGGSSRIVTQVHHLSGHEELSWSPDGKMIAYNADMGIWVVPANGGKPRRVETGLDESLVRNYVSWSPNGQTLAFAGYRIVDPELWLMEDFLPLVKQ